jgi:hypothetical protein
MSFETKMALGGAAGEEEETNKEKDPPPATPYREGSGMLWALVCRHINRSLFVIAPSL